MKQLYCGEWTLFVLFCVGVKFGVLTSRQEYRLRVCDRRVVRVIFDWKGVNSKGMQKIL
jgi:hypothetical protein